MILKHIGQALLLVLTLFTLTLASNYPTPVHAAGPTGSFSWTPQYILAGGNDSFTAFPSGGTPPYQLVWKWGDGSTNSSSHGSSSGSFTVNATIPSATHSTTTSVTCAPGSVIVSVPTSCTVTVRDISTSPISATGTVTLSSNNPGTFSPSPTCTVAPGPGSGNATCTVAYTPALAGSGAHAITGTYVADTGHTGISRGVFTLSVTTPTSGHSTTTSLSCNPGSINVGGLTICTATVTDTSGNPTFPFGTVTLVSDSPGSFNSSPPQCGLSSNAIVGTASCFIGYDPSQVGSGAHTITASYSGEAGIQVTHIFSSAGSYLVTLTITDSANMVATIVNTVPVHGSPLAIDGWTVNWNITAHHGIEIYNVSYNGIPTIRDALINGIQVTYYQQPPGLSCIFFDDLGNDDLASSIAGLTVQNSTDPSNPWFQIRAQYNPSEVGYNYTQYWRFYQNGRWDATLYAGHLGCGWNHTYQVHWRIDLTLGDKNQDVMGQYSPSGSWRNLIWEGNYTDNGTRDPSHNSTQWRVGDGIGFYYMTPVVDPWAKDMPLIPSKIYLVRDHPGELEPDINPPQSPMDPIIFVNRELAYRQSIALWYVPTFWDHWLSSPGNPQVAPPSFVGLQFYPSGI